MQAVSAELTGRINAATAALTAEVMESLAAFGHADTVLLACSCNPYG